MSNRPVGRGSAVGAGPTGSNLLNALRSEDLALLEPLFQHWTGPPGHVLYEPGDSVRFVYFPCGPSVVSFRVVLADGPDVETVLVGREGAIGGIVSHGRLPAYARSIVQFAGPFLRAECGDIEEVKRRSPSLRHFFSRYADCLLAQVFQSVACNAAHTIEQRTAKWLLATIDRTGDHHISLTQEQLAGMLGVGRTYVNRVIRSLKARGALRTSRGRMQVQDVEQLGRIACHCNLDVQRHFEEVLRGVYPAAAAAGAPGVNGQVEPA